MKATVGQAGAYENGTHALPKKNGMKEKQRAHHIMHISHQRLILFTSWVAVSESPLKTTEISMLRKSLASKEHEEAWISK